MDNSYDRVRRLREVLNLYTPPSYVKDKVVQVAHANGIFFANEIKNHMKFDKVRSEYVLKYNMRSVAMIPIF